MSNILTGPNAQDPWIERSVVECLEATLSTTTTTMARTSSTVTTTNTSPSRTFPVQLPRCIMAQVIDMEQQVEEGDDASAVVWFHLSDGSHSIWAVVSPQAQQGFLSQGGGAMGCIVRLIQWNIVTRQDALKRRRRRRQQQQQKNGQQRRSSSSVAELHDSQNENYQQHEPQQKQYPHSLDHGGTRQQRSSRRRRNRNDNKHKDDEMDSLLCLLVSGSFDVVGAHGLGTVNDPMPIEYSTRVKQWILHYQHDWARIPRHLCVRQSLAALSSSSSFSSSIAPHHQPTTPSTKQKSAVAAATIADTVAPAVAILGDISKVLHNPQLLRVITAKTNAAKQTFVEQRQAQPQPCNPLIQPLRRVDVQQQPERLGDAVTTTTLSRTRTGQQSSQDSMQVRQEQPRQQQQQHDSPNMPCNNNNINTVKRKLDNSIKKTSRKLNANGLHEEKAVATTRTNDGSVLAAGPTVRTITTTTSLMIASQEVSEAEEEEEDVEDMGINSMLLSPEEVVPKRKRSAASGEHNQKKRHSGDVTPCRHGPIGQDRMPVEMPCHVQLHGQKNDQKKEKSNTDNHLAGDETPTSNIEGDSSSLFGTQPIDIGTQPFDTQPDTLFMSPKDSQDYQESPFQLRVRAKDETPTTAASAEDDDDDAADATATTTQPIALEDANDMEIQLAFDAAERTSPEVLKRRLNASMLMTEEEDDQDDGYGKPKLMVTAPLLLESRQPSPVSQLQHCTNHGDLGPSLTTTSATASPLLSPNTNQGIDPAQMSHVSIDNVTIRKKKRKTQTVSHGNSSPEEITTWSTLTSHDDDPQSKEQQQDDDDDERKWQNHPNSLIEKTLRAIVAQHGTLRPLPTTTRTLKEAERPTIEWPGKQLRTFLYANSLE